MNEKHKTGCIYDAKRLSQVQWLTKVLKQVTGESMR